MTTITDDAAINYLDAIDAIAPGASQAAAQGATPGDFPAMLAAVVDAARSIITTDAQRRMLDIQLDRARNGLPPLALTPAPQGFTLTDGQVKTAGLLLAGVALIALSRRPAR